MKIIFITYKNRNFYLSNPTGFFYKLSISHFVLFCFFFFFLANCSKRAQHKVIRGRIVNRYYNCIDISHIFVCVSNIQILHSNNNRFRMEINFSFLVTNQKKYMKCLKVFLEHIPPQMCFI